MYVRQSSLLLISAPSEKVIVFSFWIYFMHCIRKATPVATNISTPAAEGNSPSVMVKSSRLCAY